MGHRSYFSITSAQRDLALKVQSSTRGRQCAWVVVHLCTFNLVECKVYYFYIVIVHFEDTKVHDFVENMNWPRLYNIHHFETKNVT